MIPLSGMGAVEALFVLVHSVSCRQAVKTFIVFMVAAELVVRQRFSGIVEVVHVAMEILRFLRHSTITTTPPKDNFYAGLIATGASDTPYHGRVIAAEIGKPIEGRVG